MVVAASSVVRILTGDDRMRPVGDASRAAKAARG
jgi:hypothetical protein